VHVPPVSCVLYARVSFYYCCSCSFVVCEFLCSISERIKSKRDKILSRFVSTILGHITTSAGVLHRAAPDRSDGTVFQTHKLRIMRSVSALKVRAVFA
jgi:hypothetical protein